MSGNTWLSAEPSFDRGFDTFQQMWQVFQFTQYDRPLQAVRTADYKLIRGSDGERELYDLAADSKEASEVSAAMPAIVDELAVTLDEWLTSFEHATTDGAVAITGERKERLEQLGYLQ